MMTKTPLETLRGTPLIALAVLLAGCVAPPPPVPNTPPTVSFSRLEREIVEETNLARRDPQRYAALIEQQLAQYDGMLLRRPGQVPVRTDEGPAAAREAARALRALRPLPTLAYSPGMSAGARDLVRDQRRGRTGHRSSDGSTASDRVNRYGRWNVTISENIAYGPSTARDVVIGLIVDDGVRDRGHRKNIFDPVARVIGVACGEHAEYTTACVIVYAGSYAEKGGRATP